MSLESCSPRIVQPLKGTTNSRPPRMMRFSPLRRTSSGWMPSARVMSSGSHAKLLNPNEARTLRIVEAWNSEIAICRIPGMRYRAMLATGRASKSEPSAFMRREDSIPGRALECAVPEVGLFARRLRIRCQILPGGGGGGRPESIIPHRGTILPDQTSQAMSIGADFLPPPPHRRVCASTCNEMQ